MAMSIPASDLCACVNHGLNAIGKFCPGAACVGAMGIGELVRRGLIVPQGRFSANDTCRLLSCVDGWLGVNLPRESDWELLNSWLAIDELLSNWQTLTNAVASRSGLALTERGREMGLPLAFVASNALAEFSMEFFDSAPTCC